MFISDYNIMMGDSGSTIKRRDSGNTIKKSGGGLNLLNP